MNPSKLYVKFARTLRLFAVLYIWNIEIKIKI